MSEEEISAELLGDSLMLGKRPPVVGRQRVNTGCKRRQQRDHGIRDRLRCFERSQPTNFHFTCTHDTQVTSADHRQSSSPFVVK